MVRLPWVSRAAYEAMAFAYEREIVSHAEDRKRNDELVATVVQMKRDGFTAPITLPVLPFEPEQRDDLPNPVLDALDEIGLTGAQLEQHKDWARRRLRREKNAEIVAEELLAGGLVMEEPEA